MKTFNYDEYEKRAWDNEVLGIVSAIHEYRGKQDLFLKQKPATLEKLMKTAKVQSTAASNEIEGIRTSDTRLKQLFAEKTTPQTRDEEEIEGYRYVLNEIHESFEYIPLTPNYILQLHKDLYRYSHKSIGGSYKNGQNQIVSTNQKGREIILFTPLSAFETPAAMDRLCDTYNRAIYAENVDALLLIPIFIHDFLCIHPFNDGNGRLSRLLTTLLLFRSGYVVGRFASLESKIAGAKVQYYEALQDSQTGWHEGIDDPVPFIKYLLRTILSSYRDFEERVIVAEEKPQAIDQVRDAINRRIGKFSKSEIMEMCPAIGRASVENSLARLVEEQYVDRHGTGRSTYYTRHDARLS